MRAYDSVLNGGGGAIGMAPRLLRASICALGDADGWAMRFADSSLRGDGARSRPPDGGWSVRRTNGMVGPSTVSGWSTAANPAIEARRRYVPFGTWSK